jgi:membrane protease YdiL (CAAX protease family)
MIPKRKSKLRKRASEKAAAPSRYAKRSSYAITILLLLLIVLFSVLYSKSYIDMPTLVATSSIAFSLFLTSIVFSWMLSRGSTPGQIISCLGLGKDRLSAKMLGIGILLFIAVIILGLVISAVSTATNVPLPTNVQDVLAGAPLYFLIFTAIIAPINEEIFFRGFLVTKLGKMFGMASGIVLGALIFAVFHLSYLSVSEFAAALFFGLVAGYAFVRTKSLYPSIVGHMLVNIVTITSLIYVGMLIHP